MNPPRFAPYFGDYFLIGKIADEATFEVWLARQESWNRRVTLRVLRSEHLGSNDAIHRFEVIANASARLRHEDIVQVYEIGNYRGRPFISMEYLEGGSLAEQLAAGYWIITPVNHGERQAAIARLMIRIARAVHHAHQHGVLHGQLTSADVLFDAAGHPRVAHFGLVIPGGDDAAASGTPEGAVWGRPLEEDRGSPEDITTSTDIAGLGAVLFHLLAGQSPDSSGWSSAQSPKPRDVNPNVDIVLERICLTSLRGEPDGPYSCANEMANELQRWLQGGESRPKRSVRQTMHEVMKWLRWNI